MSRSNRLAIALQHRRLKWLGRCLAGSVPTLRPGRAARRGGPVQGPVDRGVEPTAYAPAANRPQCWCFRTHCSRCSRALACPGSRVFSHASPSCALNRPLRVTCCTSIPSSVAFERPSHRVTGNSAIQLAATQVRQAVMRCAPHLIDNLNSVRHFRPSLCASGFGQKET